MRRVVSGLLILLLVVIGLLPLLVMVGQSLVVHGRLSTEFYQVSLASARTWILLGHSVALALLTTLFAVGLGMPLGILLGRTDLPCRTLLLAFFAIPLLVPPYITAVSWSYALGREGLVARWLGAPMAQQTAAWLFGLPGCVLVLGSTFLPIVMFLTMTSLQSVNPRLEEAGRLVSGWFGALKGISLPIALPGILLSAILVFLLSLGEVSVPTFLRYPVFSVESFTQFAAFHEVGAATASATLLALIALFVLVVERQYIRRPLASLQPTSDRASTVPIALGPLRAWWFMFVCLLCGVVVVVPLLVLVLQSASLTAHVEAFSRAGDSLLRSFAYAALGASCLTMLGFFLGYFIARRRLQFWQALDFLTVTLLTLPSTVIGVALVTLWNRPATLFIYATPLIVLFGYLAQYTALTSRICFVFGIPA
ncbi:MAG: iron ABC transporter permease [Candidatus Omnitrophica bacterium]|nr:iron ABC transporter permease [Candidatus Omnitrophota bacterium]